MATNAENLLNSIREEIMRGFEGLKTATEQSFNVIVEDSKRKMEERLRAAEKSCQDVGKHTDNNNVKKDVQKLVKDMSNDVSQIEKDSINLINETWATAKMKLNRLLDSSKVAMGGNKQDLKDVEKNLKDIQKSMDKVVADFTKLVHESSKDVQAQLKEVCQNLK